MKRCIVLIIYLVTTVISLTNDGRENRLDRMEIGYTSENAVGFLENTVRSDEYYDNMILLTVKRYGTEENMLEAIRSHRIDIAFLSDRYLLRGQDSLGAKVVLEYRISNDDTLMICVDDQMLYENLDNVLNTLKVIDAGNENKTPFIKADEWEKIYANAGYGEEITQHILYDFQDELLR